MIPLLFQSVPPPPPSEVVPQVDAVSRGRIIITEIMYNPASIERSGETEWIEIANVGDEEVIIDGWKLVDEDTQAWSQWGSFSCTLAPNQVAVLINQDAVTEAEFRAAWDGVPRAESDEAMDEGAAIGSANYLIVPVVWGSLANAPGPTNELLKLVDSAGAVVCEAHFQAGATWPKLERGGGASIWLSDIRALNLNDGRIWRSSDAGRDGAVQSVASGLFSGRDIGSPGHVPGLGSPAAGDDAPAESDAPPRDNRIDYE